jgi:CRP/FNR family transcriptional regulator, cyclic AMP receptor protein
MNAENIVAHTSVGMSEGDRKYLIEHAAVRRYPRGRYLFNQGDDPTSLFVVLEGEVEIFVENYQARTIIAREPSGKLVGELEILGGCQYRLGSAVTLTDSTLGVIRKSVFEQCIRNRPELGAGLAHHLAVANGEMMTRLSTLPLDAYGRLRSCLNSRLARETSGCLVVPGLWTQQQLAELIGCARETVGKILGELMRGGWIRHDRQQVTILRPLPEDF